MPQFDVHRNIGATKAAYPYVVVLQSSLFRDRARWVVIPLAPATPDLPRNDRLNPIFDLEGRRYGLATLAIFNLPKEQLGPVVANLTAESDTIIAAVDWMMSRGWG
ncbi:CcdB family protein [Inquilinus sp. OTU3971]|uniref:CcdB family protein n=1 Tax=Inquilinus sp. OTU3971 TaxID=3043855 RepID=UPI00313F2AD0